MLERIRSNRHAAPFLLFIAMLMVRVSCRIPITGFGNQYYQGYRYTGSRVLEHNVSGRFSSYTEFEWSQSATQDPQGRIWLVDRNYHVVLYLEPSARYFDWPASYKHYAGQRDRSGYYDGSRLKAMFNGPAGIALTAVPGKPMMIYVADTNNHCLRRLNYNTGRTETIAGSPRTRGLLDGPGTQAKFNYPISLGVDSNDHVFVLDNGRKLRKVDMSTPMFMVTTLVDGACRLVSRSIIASSIVVRKVGCHSDWSVHDTQEEVERFEFSVFCKGHGVSCGPRNHPMISDKVSLHLKYEKPDPQMETQSNLAGSTATASLPGAADDQADSEARAEAEAMVGES